MENNTNSISPLRNRGFLSFFSVKLLAAFNDSFIQAGFMAFVSSALISTADSAQHMIFMATGLFMLPVFLFSALAGEMSDKYDKAKMLRYLKIFEIFIALVMGISFYTESVNGMLLGMFLAGVEASFFTPIRLSIVPFLTGKGSLIQANSALESGSYIFKFAGTMLGIVAGASINPWFPLALLVLSVLGFLSARMIPAQESSDPDAKVDKLFLRSTWTNLKYAKYSKQIFLSLMGLAGAWCITITFMIHLPEIAKTIFINGFGSQVLNYLFLGPFCLGIGVGAICAAKVYKKDPVNAYMPLCAVVEALIMTDFALQVLFHTPTVAPIGDISSFAGKLDLIKEYLTSFSGLHMVLCIFLVTFFSAMFIVPVTAYLQDKSPDAIKTRVMSANNITAALFLIISTVIGMICTGVFGEAGGISMMAILLALVCIAGALITVGILPIPILRAVVKRCLSIFYHARCEGLENFEAAKTGRTLIIANHTSFLDGIIIWAYLHDNLTYAVDRTIASKWYYRAILSLAPSYYAIDSKSPMGIRSLIKEIDQGKIPVVFPEGRITTTGTLMKIYSGTAIVADKADAKILPVIIDGSQYSIFSRFGNRFHKRPRSRIVVNVMPATCFNVPEEYKGRRRTNKAADMMYDLLTEMKVKASVMTDNTIFASYIDAMNTVGSGKKILEDHNLKSLSAGQVFVKAMALGKYFKAHDPENAVGLLLPNSAAGVVAFFGLQAAGKLPCMLNFSVGAKNLVACCDAVPLKVVYTSKAFIKAGFAALDTALRDHGITVKYLEDVPGQIGFWTKLTSFMSLLRPFKSYYRLAGGRPSSDSPAIVLFTSGSEGLPKGVVLSHRNVETNIVQLQAVLPFGMLDSVFNSMPMFHSFGLSAGTLLPLLSGMKVFMYPSPLHYKTVPLLVYNSNSTAIFGTNTFLKGYAEYAHPYDMYSVKFAVSGGEKLHEDTINLWHDKFGIRILEGYGATETSPVISVNTNMYYRRNTAGRILPGMESRLERVEGIDEGGRLWVHGDNVMMGYYRSTAPGVLEEPENKWYDTGDIATIDDSGFISIKGRAKRFAKVAGEMISLTQVETVLSSLYPQIPLAVIAVPDKKKGEQLMLFTTSSEVSKVQIRQSFIEEGLSELAVPKYIQVVEKIPLNGTGKVDYLKVRELADEILKTGN